MLLEDYFDFLSQDDIRIKETRVGIETIITDYLNGRFPEEIPNHYPSITLEQVFATLTYYYRNKEAVDNYIQDWRNHGERVWQAQQRSPSPRIQAVQQMIREQKATYNTAEK